MSREVGNRVTEVVAAMAKRAGQDRAMQMIRDLAGQHDLAVSVVTVEDVLFLRGLPYEDSTAAQRQAVTDSYEWRHYGDDWANWFDGIEINEKGGQ